MWSKVIRLRYGEGLGRRLWVQGISKFGAKWRGTFEATANLAIFIRLASLGGGPQL